MSSTEINSEVYVKGNDERAFVIEFCGRILVVHFSHFVQELFMASVLAREWMMMVVKGGQHHIT